MPVLLRHRHPLSKDQVCRAARVDCQATSVLYQHPSELQGPVVCSCSKPLALGTASIIDGDWANSNFA